MRKQYWVCETQRAHPCNFFSARSAGLKWVIKLCLLKFLPKLGIHNFVGQGIIRPLFPAPTCFLVNFHCTSRLCHLS